MLRRLRLRWLRRLSHLSIVILHQKTHGRLMHSHRALNDWPRGLVRSAYACVTHVHCFNHVSTGFTRNISRYHKHTAIRDVARPGTKFRADRPLTPVVQGRVCGICSLPCDGRTGDPIALLAVPWIDFAVLLARIRRVVWDSQSLFSEFARIPQFLPHWLQQLRPRNSFS